MRRRKAVREKGLRRSLPKTNRFFCKHSTNTHSHRLCRWLYLSKNYVKRQVTEQQGEAFGWARPALRVQSNGFLNFLKFKNPQLSGAKILF